MTTAALALSGQLSRRRRIPLNLRDFLESHDEAQHRAGCFECNYTRSVDPESAIGGDVGESRRLQKAYCGRGHDDAVRSMARNPW